MFWVDLMGRSHARCSMYYHEEVGSKLKIKFETIDDEKNWLVKVSRERAKVGGGWVAP